MSQKSFPAPNEKHHVSTDILYTASLSKWTNKMSTKDEGCNLPCIVQTDFWLLLLSLSELSMPLYVQIYPCKAIEAHAFFNNIQLARKMASCESNACNVWLHASTSSWNISLYIKILQKVRHLRTAWRSLWSLEDTLYCYFASNHAKFVVALACNKWSIWKIRTEMRDCHIREPSMKIVVTLAIPIKCLADC